MGPVESTALAYPRPVLAGGYTLRLAPHRARSVVGQFPARSTRKKRPLGFMVAKTAELGRDRGLGKCCG